jgi:exopolysaccharide biosynthesis polyprenyl glycosylphosphotransferase
VTTEAWAATKVGAAEAGFVSAFERRLIDAVDNRTRAILERRHELPYKRRGWLVRRMLLIADVVGLTLAFMLAEFFARPTGLLTSASFQAEVLLFVLSLPFWIVLAKLHGLYEGDKERADHSTADDVVGVLHLTVTGLWLIALPLWLLGVAEPTFRKLALFPLAAVILVTAGRGLARAVSRRSVFYLQNTVVIGAGDVGQLVARKLLQHPEYGINLVGFIDRQPREPRVDLEHLTLLGMPNDLPEIARLLDVERVIIAFSNEPEEEMLDMVRSCRELDLQVDIVPRLYELVSPRVDVHTVEGLPLVGLPPVRLTPSARLLKRTMDLAGATLGLLLTAPLFAYIAIRIKLDSEGPVFFRQTRLGLNGEPFTVIKFRTMRVGVDEEAHRVFIRETMTSKAGVGSNGLYKLERGSEITTFGAWLRKTSLDELPQLLNVLRGEMSLVGPRPCIPYETENFQPHHHERFLVPAGVTGLWQVTARARSTFGEALDMDVAYVRGWSLGLDLKLLVKTPVELLRKRTTA